MKPDDIRRLAQGEERYTFHCSNADDLDFIADWFNTAIRDWTYLSKRLVTESEIIVDKQANAKQNDDDSSKTADIRPNRITFGNKDGMLFLKTVNAQEKAATALINPHNGNLELVDTNDDDLDFFAEWMQKFASSFAGLCTIMELYPGYITPDDENQRLAVDISSINFFDPWVKEMTPRIVPYGSDKIYDKLINWMTKYYGDMTNILNSTRLPFEDVVVCNYLNQPLYYAKPDESNQTILFSLYMWDAKTDTHPLTFTTIYNTVTNEFIDGYRSRNVLHEEDTEWLRYLIPIENPDIDDILNYVLQTYSAICTWISDVTVETRHRKPMTQQPQKEDKPKENKELMKPYRERKPTPLLLTGRIVKITASAINHNEHKRIPSVMRNKPDHIVHVRGFIRHYASGKTGPVKAHDRYKTKPEKNIPTYTIRPKDIARKNRKRKTAV